jgi:hypothetical protein
MKVNIFKRLAASGLALLGLAVLPGAVHAVNVSIGVGGEVLPGVYGTVNIDNGRYPVLVYDEPLIVRRQARIASPVYLHVPPGHLKKWGKYCDRYGACARPVYFVKSRDYYDFSPRYIEQRYVYRDRVVYVDDDRRDYRRKDRDRWDKDDRWDDDDRRKYKDKDKDKGRGKGRDRDDD